MIHRSTEPIQMRNYGRIIQNMIAYACSVQDTAQQQALVLYIAQCMSQRNLTWNRDQEAGTARVIADIRRLSNNRLDCSFPELQALTIEQQNRPQQGQNFFKKKKK